MPRGIVGVEIPCSFRNYSWRWHRDPLYTIQRDNHSPSDSIRSQQDNQRTHSRREWIKFLSKGTNWQSLWKRGHRDLFSRWHKVAEWPQSGLFCRVQDRALLLHAREGGRCSAGGSGPGWFRILCGRDWGSGAWRRWHECSSAEDYRHCCRTGWAYVCGHTFHIQTSATLVRLRFYYSFD